MQKLVLFIVFFIFSELLNAQSPFVQWVKNFGGNGIDVGTSISIDRSGNSYTVGRFEGTCDFNPNSGIFDLTTTGGQDVFITKLNPQGNFIWAKKIGGSSTDYSKSIAVDTLHNVYITGNFYGNVDFDPGSANYFLNSSGANDIFILKLDSSGNFKWAKKIGSTIGDIGNKLKLDKSGNVYVTGYFTGTVDFDPDAVGVYNLSYVAGHDIFVLKLKSNGDFAWAKQLGGNSIDEGTSIDIDGNGNVYTTGIFQSTGDFDPSPSTYTLSSDGGSSDIFISKLDSSGNFVWAKKMGGPLSDVPNHISSDKYNNTYITGYFSGTADFDPGPSTYTLTSNGLTDICIAKLDSLGEFVWAKNLGSNSYDQALSVFIDNNNDVYTTGYFSNTCDFDTGTNTYTLTSAGSSDAFILKLDSSGDFKWASRVGNINSDVGYDFAGDNNGSVYWTGGFQGSVNFDLGLNSINSNSIDSVDAFVVKFGYTDVGLKESVAKNHVSIFPNPTTGILNFDFMNQQEFKIEIYNSYGQKEIDEIINTSKKSININHLPNGIYFINIINDHYDNNSFKLIKE